MKRFLCVALLCAVGCTSVPTNSAPAASPTTAPAAAAAKEHGWQVWIPAFFADLWESFDARIGMDYGFGAHLKVTDLARIGIFDYSDFSLIGVDKGIFKGEYAFPDLRAWNKNGSWDLSVKVGVGLGAEATLHTEELIDAITTLVTLDYWSLNDD
jgi:hypothetical protein